jgi:hypothetical protein
MYLDLEKLDEAAAMFGFLTSSGILSKDHVFYEQVHSFCSSAMGLVDEHVLPSLYPALTRFQHAIQFNCKPSYIIDNNNNLYFVLLRFAYSCQRFRWQNVF